MMKIQKVLVVACVVALLVPTLAFAQSSTEGYGGSNNVVAGLEEGNGGGGGGDSASGTVSADTSGSLPFTGSDLAVLAAAGGLLMALGFGLRRATHRPSET